jgi:replicative superfamily II helicase
MVIPVSKKKRDLSSQTDSEDTSPENKNGENLYNLINPLILDKLKTSGIVKLYPPQELALVPALHKKNIVVCVPTASGKTLIAEITMVQRILEFKSLQKPKKALYLCPLKALASEKYQEFRKKWASLGISVGYSIGDVDMYDYRAFQNDIIVMTNEKADSLLRSKPEHIKDIGVLVSDEIHLINDNDRGVTLEILLTRILSINKNIQIIGLSATISNANELATWLKAELIKSDWRPVDLKEGCYVDKEIVYKNNERKSVKYSSKEPVFNLVSDVLDDGGQCLIFLNTRKNAESQAEKLSMMLQNRYSQEELDKFNKVAKIFEEISNPADLTKDSKFLIQTLKHGVGFHHAGLTQEQRTFIENNFRKGIIKALTATPTLAAGVNTPARRVIIKTLYRYDKDGGGMVKIPIIEYKQMSGRAGRPGYDPYGDSIIIASNPKQAEELVSYYLFGEPEIIISKLNNPDMLQIHILGLISSKGGISDDSIVQFLNSTFLCHQIRFGTNEIQGITEDNLDMDREMFHESLTRSRARAGRKSARGADPLGLPEFDEGFKSAAEIMDDPDYVELTKKGYKKSHSVKQDELRLKQPILSEEEINRRIQKILKESLEFLRIFKFIERKTIPSVSPVSYHYTTTELGLITSQLYLKPMSAESLFRRLKLLQKIQTEGPATLIVNELSLLHAISLTKEIQGIPFRKPEFDMITSLYRKFKNNIEMFTFQYDTEENQRVFDDMDCLKQTFILREWINEVPEANITDTFAIGSGDLSRCVDTAEWMARGIIRFAKLLKDARLSELANNLNKRIKYGIKAELLPLISLKGIGRVRARLLYKNGIISPRKILEASDADLTKIPLISQNLVDSIKQQIRTGSNLKAGEFLKEEQEEDNKLEDLDIVDINLDEIATIPEDSEDKTDIKVAKNQTNTASSEVENTIKTEGNPEEQKPKKSSKQSKLF